MQKTGEQGERCCAGCCGGRLPDAGQIQTAWCAANAELRRPDRVGEVFDSVLCNGGG